MSRTVRRLVRDMRSNGSGAAHPRQRGADPRAMREANRLLVLNCLREQGPLARVTLAQHTGLSRTTVSSQVERLLHEGLVREGEPQSAAPSGGRRPILVHFNETAGYILGVDLGRTHCTLVAANLAAEVVARQSGPCDTNRGPQVTLPLLIAEIREFVAKQGIAWDRVLGIGMGIPGPVDNAGHRLVSPPRMPGWHGVDIPAILGRELNVPIYLGNDANMGALGESRFGAGQGVEVLAYVKVGTGIGCGLVVDGQVYAGSRGFAGELGHMTIDELGPQCECGNRGCLEAVTGAPAIVADAAAGLSLRRLTEKGDPPVSAAGPPALAGCALADIADVVQAAQANDAASQAAIMRAGELIGIALASLVNLVNPSLILVDGGVARAGALLIEPIRRAIAARSLAAASSVVRIEQGALGDRAIALGAVATVLDAAFGAPAALTAIPPKRKEAAENALARA